MLAKELRSTICEVCVGAGPLGEDPVEDAFSTCIESALGMEDAVLAVFAFEVFKVGESEDEDILLKKETHFCVTQKQRKRLK